MTIDPVVAGVDGSTRDAATIEAATREAMLRRRPLRLVHAYAWPPAGSVLVPELAVASLQAYTDRARKVMAEAVRMASPVNATTVVRRGSPAAVLRDESRRACLLVLGERRDRPLAGLMLGSVAVKAAARSACPVLVVRGEPRPGGPVLAGVDGSPASIHALTYAAEAAARRDADLIVLQACPPGPDDTGPVTDEELSFAATLAALTGRHPGLRLRWQIRPGPARRVLTYFSRTAQLIVVGDRGFGGVAGLLLGSVSQHLIHKSACPTVVVHRSPLRSAGG
ncbi:MAG: universal stress protein [Actinoplanes sp.]